MTNHENLNTRNQLSGPSDLIAAIPGILGYYPQESAIVMVFELDEECDAPLANYSTLSRSMRLGPVVRTDLKNVSKLARAMREAAPFDEVLHVAVVVAKDRDADHVKEAMEILYDLEDSDGLPLIDVCWTVPEIITGNEYSMEFDSMSAAWRNAGYAVPGDWESGEVANVALSPSMRPLLDNGGLPALSRSEAYGYFRPDVSSLSATHKDDRSKIARTAYLRADDLLCGAAPHGVIASQLIDEACAIAAGVKPRALVALDDRPEIDEVLPNRDDVLALATVLARSKLRDCLVAPAIESPREYATALICMANNFEGVIRANALSVWAIIATSLGVSSMASAALLVAQEELVGHSLSDALLQGQALGDHDGLLDAVVRGSKLQRRLIDEESN